MSPSTPASSVRGRRARATVLEAATGLFAARGYDGVALAEIAAAAGVSKPAVLYHFADKAELWRACVDALWGEVDAFYAEHWPRHLPPGEELMRRSLHLFIDAGLRWPAYIRIPFIEGSAPSWRSEWLVETHFRRHVTSTDHVIRACQRRGLLPAGEPAHLQSLFTSGINVFLAQPGLWEVALGKRLAAAEPLRAQVDLILSLTFRSGTLDKPRNTP